MVLSKLRHTVKGYLAIQTGKQSKETILYWERESERDSNTDPQSHTVSVLSNTTELHTILSITYVYHFFSRYL